MGPLVNVTNVSKEYPETTALDGVSLSIRAGESVAIMGPSGSGKSTLLNLIAGLDRPTGGSVVVDGVDVGVLSETGLAKFRRRHIGMIFQFFNLLDDLTVIDNVLIPAHLAGVARPAAVARASELLDRLGMAEHHDVYPARLSGGERQRVAIARALMNEPSLLLADEPTGALDTRTGADVLELLRDLNQAGQTLVLVTHDSRLAEACTERIVQLVDGRISDPTAAVTR